MAWRAFNTLMNKPRVLVLDARSLSAYSAGHIRGSICVTCSPSSRTLQRVAGPGPPSWSDSCWWDRHVLVITSTHFNPPSRKRKKSAVLENEAPDSSACTVYNFLQKEGLVRSLQLLEKNEGEEDAFVSFAKTYPFLVTKSTKASKIENYPTEIVSGLLFLGDMQHAKAENRLKDLQISQVLTIHTEPLELSESFVHTHFDLEDAPSADISQYFEPMYEFVERAKTIGARVLVHCGAGASRSATLCAAYLMRARHCDVDAVLKFLKEQRSQVNPNPGFLSALQQYSHVVGLAAQKKSETTGLDCIAIGLHLDIIKGAKCVGNLPLNQKSLSFGRGADCDVILDHASISRHHALLKKHEDNLWRLTDTNSTYGTYVNGKVLSKDNRILQVGDILKFGESTRTYILCDDTLCRTPNI